MTRVGSLIVVGQVTAYAGIGCCIVIPVMAGNTGFCNMGPCQNIIVVVDREGCRCPVRVCRMAGIAGCRVVSCHVVRVYRCIIIRRMAAGAGIGRIYIITLVAGKAIGGDGCVGAGEWV